MTLRRDRRWHRHHGARGGGTDTIQTALSSYQLKANVENLVHTGGTAHFDGNAAGNRLPAAPAPIRSATAVRQCQPHRRRWCDAFTVTSATTVATESSEQREFVL